MKGKGKGMRASALNAVFILATLVAVLGPVHLLAVQNQDKPWAEGLIKVLG